MSGLYTAQLVAESPAGYLMGDESVCLDAPQWREPDAGVRFTACGELGRQKWKINKADSTAARIVHTESGLCLAVSQAATSDPVTLAACLETRKEQLWLLKEEQWRDES